MHVRMKVSMHGPSVSRDPGQVHEVSDEEGARLIRADFAEAVEQSGTAPAKRRTTRTDKAADTREMR